MTTNLMGAVHLSPHDVCVDDPEFDTRHFYPGQLVWSSVLERMYQMTVGESRTGVEIKHDEKYATTGNLWIETGEKARPRDGDYYPSGICRDDNSWFYLRVRRNERSKVRS